jgi:hypothetical protein
MATVGETSRPGYVYDSATDVWIPVGIGPHSHTPAAIGAISSSVVTTKGDLIVATGSGVVTRQGVGADGSYLVADSTQADGLNWAGPSNMAGRNAVLNSNFSVWQRGTTFTIASNTITYTADRWAFYRNATGATVTRQVTNDTTNLPFIQYCMRVARDSGNTSTQQLQLAQGFESVNSIPFVNKSIALSFYARSGANYSATSSALTVQLIGGTGTDQSAFAYTGTTTPINTTATLTTTWQRFTFTGTIGSTVTEIAPRFFFDPVGTAGANDYFEITGVQLEVGSVATPYAPNGATYQAELAACQRYYEKSYDVATQPGSLVSEGNIYFYLGAATTSNVGSSPRFKVSKRVAPTVTIYSSATGGTGIFTNGQAASVIHIGTEGFTAYQGTAVLSFEVRGQFTASAEI